MLLTHMFYRVSCCCLQSTGLKRVEVKVLPVDRYYSREMTATRALVHLQRGTLRGTLRERLRGRLGAHARPRKTCMRSRCMRCMRSRCIRCFHAQAMHQIFSRLTLPYFQWNKLPADSGAKVTLVAYASVASRAPKR